APRNDSDIYVIPVAGGTPRKVATLVGTENGVTWSPDSRRLAFVHRPARTAQARLMAVDATGGEPVNLTPDWQYEPGAMAWLANGEIAMWAEIGGSSALHLVNARSGRMRTVLDGRRKLRDFSFD